MEVKNSINKVSEEAKVWTNNWSNRIFYIKYLKFIEIAFSPVKCKKQKTKNWLYSELVRVKGTLMNSLRVYIFWSQFSSFNPNLKFILPLTQQLYSRIFILASLQKDMCIRMFISAFFCKTTIPRLLKHPELY